jgi:hypothetical protein
VLCLGAVFVPTCCGDPPHAVRGVLSGTAISLASCTSISICIMPVLYLYQEMGTGLELTKFSCDKLAGAPGRVHPCLDGTGL